MGSEPAEVVRADQLEEAGGPGQVAVGGALPRGPAGSGRVPGDREETAGVLRDGVLERLLWCLRCREATYFYINSGIRGPRMPRRRVSWLSTVPWVGGGEEATRGFADKEVAETLGIGRNTISKWYKNAFFYS
jgi:hypothetical protein